MTPRIDVCGVERGTTIGGIIDIALKEGYSRLPIYEGDLDHIVGMVVVKDLLAYWSCDLSAPLPAAIVRPVTLVHGTKKIGELLSELRLRKSHLAVVLDEYGGTAGLVTMEDIIEEIVGDIHDEYDTEEVEDIKELSPGVFLATGQASVTDLNDSLSLSIPHGNYETLGGFLTHQLGRVPLIGEEIPFGEHLFRIREADDRKVDQVEICGTSIERGGAAEL